MTKIPALWIGLMLIMSGAFVALEMNGNVKAADVAEKAFAGGSFGGGNGTAGNPYVIEDVLDLQNMSANLNGHYVLVNDIDASDTVTWNSGTGFTPVGDYPSNIFNGSLDGNNHTITGLYINRPSTLNIALFGYISNPGVVKNVRSINYTIIGTQSVGAIVGSNYYGRVENCYASGNITGSTGVGGIVGTNRGVLINCHTAGNTSGRLPPIEDSAQIGGITGICLIGGSVINCSASGNTIGYRSVGGIIGMSFSGSLITNCTSSGNVSGYSEIGGVIGDNRASITNCHATGNVMGLNNRIGGVVGWNQNGMTNCSSSGNTTGNSNSVGGLAGENTASIINGYSSGRTSGIDAVGGIVGMCIGLLNNCFSTGNTTGRNYIGGLVGHALDSIFIDCTATGITTGTVSVGGLVGWNDFSSVSNCYAAGTTSGQTNVGGLIGSGWGSISGSLATGNTTGTNIVGGFMGKAYGAGSVITDCSATGQARGLDNIGGFAGINDKATISTSYVTGNVSGYNFTGGFVGNNSGTLENCYSNSNVLGCSTTPTDIAGFVGCNFQGSIIKCYSTGRVIYNGTADPTDKGFVGRVDTGGNYEMTGNFWDNIASSQNTTSGIATGKNTSDMQDKFTFLYARWDFIDIWSIKDGYTYPFFGWQEYTNDAPTAFDDHYRATERTVLAVPRVLGVIANDDDPDLHAWMPNLADDTITVVSYANTSIHGARVDVQADGSFIYDPTGSHVLDALGGGQFLLDHFNYTISDANGEISSATVYVNMSGVNDPPAITILPVTTIKQDTHYALLLTATDPDAGDVLTWTLLASPAWLALNATTLTLEGIPSNDDVGSHWVEVRVEDLAGANDTMGFMLTVNNVNDLPVITTVDSSTATQDVPYSVLYQADDPDGDALTWTLATNATWLSLTGNHLQGTPLNEHVGVYWVDVSVADGNGGTDSTNFTLTVNNVNDPPEITSANVETAVEGVAYSVDYAAIDVDANDTHTWAVATNATWLSIVPATGVLSGTPEPGIFYVNVTVDDGNGGTDYTNFTLTAYADSNGNGIPDYMDPDFLTVIEYNNQTMWNNATAWNNQTVNQTIPEYHNTTVWSNATVPEYHNTTVTNTETPVWAWGALIAAIVLGVVAAITVMKGGKGPKQVSGQKEPSEPVAEPQPENPEP